MFSSALSKELINRYRIITDTEALTSPTKTTIEILLEKHCDTFAFSTLPANFADETIDLDADSLAIYLLENMSGLCFHHNNTFYEILKDMGFIVRLVAGHFKRPNSTELYPIPTHAAIIVTLSDGEYLLDPGLGFSIIDLIPLDAASHTKSDFRVIKKTGDTWILHDQNKSYYEFNSLGVPLSYFQPGIETLKREDKLTSDNTLTQQGHLFYSFFFYSKRIDRKCESASALITKTNRKIVADNESAFKRLITFFGPSELVKNKMQNKDFVNGELRKMVFG